ncbi:MAG: hypothetical protein ACRENE_24675 [Polyangiaceae bacterium]
MISPRLGLPFVLAGLLVLSACADPSITLTVGDAGGGSPGDAGGDSGFDLAACKACMAQPDKPGPGCKAEYDPCIASAKCDGVLNCIYAAGCFGGKSSQFLTCGIPCVMDAGILTNNDPALTTSTALFECVVNGACGPQCVTK